MKYSYEANPDTTMEGGAAKERYPTVYLDVSPAQLKGLSLGDDIEVVLKGKVESTSQDADDNWGTGASVRIALRSSDIKGADSQDDIDDLLDGE